MAESSTRTVERALDLLAVICDGDGLTLSESSRAVDLSPSTALRLLRTLETRGFVRRGDDGSYRPGSRIIQLGAQSLSGESLVTLSRRAMEDLVAETGESAYLSTPGHDHCSLYIAIVEGTHSVRHANWVGRTVPLERSAAGQVLTGHTPPAGYVVVERGVEADVTAIAAPIRSEHRVVAALSLVIPSYRVNPADVARYGPLLVRAADTVSAGLGKTVPAAAEPV
ncbi:IclR family transcriptional regulator [Cryobacterium fucosi]|uniref:IclR family transcriptional regulator n=1 Tax=Cryobacterium fucosi TaxID=1259157 RepID=A0A4R9BBQ6_9MICO|nr:IclR family transcriptional regulator [Cryobacterium fucosi]TFD80066.1 IclR family transcriptional regulator [Cryobacterium fucosi]